MSDCLIPCLITEATAVEGRQKYNRYAGIEIHFNNRVHVKKTSINKFSLSDSLIILGSNLGLWPGLGFYQILEWVVEIYVLSGLLKRFREWNSARTV